MKKIILFVLILTTVGFAQIKNTPTSPWQRGTTEALYADTLKGAVDTSTYNLTIKDWYGVLTLFGYMDTTDAGTPGAVRVTVQYYKNGLTGWCGLATSTTDTVGLFTIVSAKWAGKYWSYPVSNLDNWYWADYARFLIYPASGDTGYFELYGGGQ